MANGGGMLNFSKVDKKPCEDDADDQGNVFSGTPEELQVVSEGDQGLALDEQQEAMAVEPPQRMKKPVAAQGHPAKEHIVGKRYFVGWDTETLQAWRVDAAGDPLEQALREWTKNLSVKPQAADIDEVLATWSDGWTGAVPGLTVQQFNARCAAAPSSTRKGPTSAPEWVGDGYFVRAKADRSPQGLVWLGHESDKKRQICQVRVDWCPNKQFAVRVLAKVAGALLAGSEDPYEVRNALMVEAGLMQEEPKDPKKKAAKQVKRDEPLAPISSAGASSPTTTRAPTTPTPMTSFRARLDRHVPMPIDIPVDVFADL